MFVVSESRDSTKGESSTRGNWSTVCPSWKATCMDGEKTRMRRMRRERIPESYLENEEPYMCGVLECKRLFHTYAELVHHASSHPAVALRWCAYSDLMA